MRAEAKKLSAITELLGNPADTLTAVRDLLAQKEALASESIQLLESAISTAVMEKVKAEHVRPLITELVRAKKPTRMADVTASLEAVLAQESVKTLLKQATLIEMGPPQQRPPLPDDDTEEVFIHIPTEK